MRSLRVPPIGKADQGLFSQATQFRYSVPNYFNTMARDIIILECTEAKAEGKPTSRYTSTRNKKSLNTPGRLEKIKYNPFLRRRTLHREMR